VPGESRKQRYLGRLAQLEARRAPWESAWWDITDQIIPYRVVRTPSQINRGDKLEGKIINTTPSMALRTLAAGMMAGITSPARKWFNLTTVAPKLAKVKKVKLYLDECQQRLETLFHTSNFYKALSNGLYLDLGGIGTAFMLEEEIEPGRVNFDALPIGQYYLDVDHEGRVDTCYRKLSFTTRQMVQKFGLEKVSQHVKAAWNASNYSQSFVVVQGIQPNDEFNYGAYGRQGMKFASCWLELDGGNDSNMLREEGFYEFPGLAPRWSVRPGDVYGRGPGWDVRADCKELQHHEARKIELIDKLSRPPLVVRGNVRNPSLLPGDYTRAGKGQEADIKPIMEVKPEALNALKVHIEEIEYRIQVGMHADLWRRIIDDDRKQRATATEIEAARQEIMLMLGPTLENVNNDLLDPVVERSLGILERADMLPLAPEELEGQPVKAQFISILHQAQQTTGLASVRGFIADVGNIAQLRADAIDNINADELVGEMAEIYGINPAAVLSKKEVEKVRAEKAKAEQDAAASEQMSRLAEGANKMGNTDPEKLSAVAQQLAPVAAAQGGLMPGGA
jgi:hypothetical protein